MSARKILIRKKSGGSATTNTTGPRQRSNAHSIQQDEVWAVIEDGAKAHWFIKDDDPDSPQYDYFTSLCGAFYRTFVYDRYLRDVADNHGGNCTKCQQMKSEGRTLTRYNALTHDAPLPKAGWAKSEEGKKYHYYILEPKHEDGWIHSLCGNITYEKAFRQYYVDITDDDPNNCARCRNALAREKPQSSPPTTDEVSLVSHFECPHCSQLLAIPPEMLGQVLQCPTCDQTFEAPQ